MNRDTEPRCANTVMRLCNDDPFEKITGTEDNLCVDAGGSTAYDDKRETACLNERFGEDVCNATITRVCEDEADIFSNLCDGNSGYTDDRITACEGIVASTNNFTDGTESANNCLNKLYTGCDADPFEKQCFVGNLYDSTRWALCADHTIASKNDACEGTNGATNNVVADYCAGRPVAEDDYGLCAGTTKGGDYTAWLGDASTGIIGVGGASEDDVDANLIAGSGSGLTLGFDALAQSEVTLTLEAGNLGADGIAIASAMVDGKLKSYAGLLSGSDLGMAISTTPRPSAEWKGKIALGRQAQGAGNAKELQIFENSNFTLTIDFGTITQLDATASLTTSEAETGTIITGTIIIEASIAAGEDKLVTGRTFLTVGSSRTVIAPLRGIIGQEGVLAVFATPSTLDFGSYAGGFVASSVCDDMPFDERFGCTGEQKDTACLENTNNLLFSSTCSGRVSSDPQFLANLETARDVYCAMDANAWELTNCLARTDQSVLDARDRVADDCENSRATAGDCTAPVATGAPSIDACAMTPYQTGCANIAFNDQRTAIADACDADSTRTTAPQCGVMIGSTTISACADNPYLLGDCENAGFNNVRVARGLFCGIRNNYFDMLCDGFGTITDLRTSFCGADSPTVNNSPFDPRCTVEAGYFNQGARDDRIAKCFMDGNGADDKLCMGAVMEQPCITNPFASGCDAKNHANRLSYCNNGVVGENGFAVSLCSGDAQGSGGAQDKICGIAGETGFGTNPFASLCKRDGVDFAAQRIYYCGTQDRTTTEMAQCGELGMTATDCLSNPFNTECETTNYFTELRRLRVDYCSNLGTDKTRLNLANINPLCNDGAVDAISEVCGDNPFALICGADYAVSRGLICKERNAENG